MKTKADVAIIGCGEAGIFAGYELKKLHPELRDCRCGTGERYLFPKMSHCGGQGENLRPL